MALLKFKNMQPPGGWWYLQRETGCRITDMSMAGLSGKVVAHRKWKGLKPDDAESIGVEIERQICTRLGRRHCLSEGAGDTWTPMPEGTLLPSFDEITSATKAAIEWLAGGGGFESDSEWRRRRDICLACPLNSPVAGCKCASIYKAVEKAVPKERRTEGLWVCGACKCSLNVKVNLPGEVIRAGNDGAGLVFPDGCWQKKMTIC